MQIQYRKAKRLAVQAEAVATKAVREKDQNHSDRVEKKKKNAAWSEKLDKKQEKERRRDKRKLKKKWIKLQAAHSVQAADDQVIGKRRRDNVDDAMEDDDGTDDWAELAREEKMAKRVRQGTISQKQFDAEFGDM